MSQTENRSEPQGLTEQDYERINRFLESGAKNDTILMGTDKAEKRIECLACGEVVGVPKFSVKAFCYTCDGTTLGSEIDDETKQVECIDCGEWITRARFSSSAYCDDCRPTSYRNLEGE